MHQTTIEDRSDEQIVTMLHRLGYDRYMDTPAHTAELVAGARASLAQGNTLPPVDIGEALADEARKEAKENGR